MSMYLEFLLGRPTGGAQMRSMPIVVKILIENVYILLYYEVTIVNAKDVHK
jgi:hypothetical protein